MAHRSHFGIKSAGSGINQSDPNEFSFNAALRSVAEGRSSCIHSNILENLWDFIYSVSKGQSTKWNSAKELVEFDPSYN